MYLPHNSPINPSIILKGLAFFFRFIYSWVISYIEKFINLPVTPQVSACIIHSRREQQSRSRKWSYLEGVDFQSRRSPRCDFAQQLKGSRRGSLVEQPPAAVLLLLPHAGLWQAWELGKCTLCVVDFALLMRAWGNSFLNVRLLPFLRKLF